MPAAIAGLTAAAPGEALELALWEGAFRRLLTHPVSSPAKGDSTAVLTDAGSGDAAIGVMRSTDGGVSAAATDTVVGPASVPVAIDATAVDALVARFLTDEEARFASFTEIGRLEAEAEATRAAIAEVQEATRAAVAAARQGREQELTALTSRVEEAEAAAAQLAAREQALEAQVQAAGTVLQRACKTSHAQTAAVEWHAEATRAAAATMPTSPKRAQSSHSAFGRGGTGGPRMASMKILDVQDVVATTAMTQLVPASGVTQQQATTSNTVTQRDDGDGQDYNPPVSASDCIALASLLERRVQQLCLDMTRVEAAAAAAALTNLDGDRAAAVGTMVPVPDAIAGGSHASGARARIRTTSYSTQTDGAAGSPSTPSSPLMTVTSLHHRVGPRSPSTRSLGGKLGFQPLHLPSVTDDYLRLPIADVPAAAGPQTAPSVQAASALPPAKVASGAVSVTGSRTTRTSQAHASPAVQAALTAAATADEPPPFQVTNADFPEHDGERVSDASGQVAMQSPVLVSLIAVNATLTRHRRSSLASMVDGQPTAPQTSATTVLAMHTSGAPVIHPQLGTTYHTPIDAAEEGNASTGSSTARSAGGGVATTVLSPVTARRASARLSAGERAVPALRSSSRDSIKRPACRGSTTRGSSRTRLGQATAVAAKAAPPGKTASSSAAPAPARLEYEKWVAGLPSSSQPAVMPTATASTGAVGDGAVTVTTPPQLHLLARGPSPTLRLPTATRPAAGDGTKPNGVTMSVTAHGTAAMRTASPLPKTLYSGYQTHSIMSSPDSGRSQATRDSVAATQHDDSRSAQVVHGPKVDGTSADIERKHALLSSLTATGGTSSVATAARHRVAMHQIASGALLLPKPADRRSLLLDVQGRMGSLQAAVEASAARAAADDAADTQRGWLLEDPATSTAERSKRVGALVQPPAAVIASAHATGGAGGGTGAANQGRAARRRSLERMEAMINSARKAAQRLTAAESHQCVLLPAQHRTSRAACNHDMHAVRPCCCAVDWFAGKRSGR